MNDRKPVTWTCETCGACEIIPGDAWNGNNRSYPGRVAIMRYIEAAHAMRSPDCTAPIGETIVSNRPAFV